VDLHRHLGDSHLFGDLALRQPAGRQAQDDQLSRCQRRSIKQFSPPLAARQDGPDRVAQHAGTGVLPDATVGALVPGGNGGGGVVEARQEEDAGARVMSGAVTEDGEATPVPLVAKHHVQEDEVHRAGVQHANRLVNPGGDDDVRPLLPEQVDGAGRRDLVVVGDHEAGAGRRHGLPKLRPRGPAGQTYGNP